MIEKLSCCSRERTALSQSFILDFEQVRLTIIYQYLCFMETCFLFSIYILGLYLTSFTIREKEIGICIPPWVMEERIPLDLWPWNVVNVVNMYYWDPFLFRHTYFITLRHPSSNIIQLNIQSLSDHFICITNVNLRSFSI